MHLLYENLRLLPTAYRLTTKDGASMTFESGMKEMVGHLMSAKAEEKSVWLIGNGGSAAIAAHIANDLVGRGSQAAGSLSEHAILTALSNDAGYENAYSHQLDAMARSGDLLIAISSSGESPNILKAAATGKRKSLRLITLTGMSAENPLRKLGDLNVYVAFQDYGSVELSHLALLHCLAWMSFEQGDAQ